MNIVVLSAFLLTAAGGAAAKTDAADGRGNPVMTELIEKGIKMPEGTVVKLRPPLLNTGMDADAEQDTIKKVLPRRYTFADFTAENSHAPIALKIRDVPGNEGYTLRVIDLYFAARGSWEVLKSKKFGDTILKKGKQQASKQAGGTMSAGFLTDKEIAKRGLKTVTKKQWSDRYFYSTMSLAEMVEVSATRYAVLSETPDGVVIAGCIDPRFANDPDHPNQWRSIIKNALGEPQLGKKHPYSGTGFYVKVMRLKAPEGAIFFELHLAFNEPDGWFNGERTLISKLNGMINFKVEQFREKLALATQDAVKQTEPTETPAR